MCYDIKTSLQTQLKKAKHNNNSETIAEIEEQLEPYQQTLFQVSGFSHPELLVYSKHSPTIPKPAYWGLIPHWVKDDKQRFQIWNKTLNARGETIFEKPSFRKAAEKSRCLIYVDGFYEHHHFKGNTYPFYIHKKDKEPMVLAGLGSVWVNKETGEQIRSCTIVTTKANRLMKKIYNNPKMNEARMPVILPDEIQDLWLSDIHSETDQKAIEKLIQPYPTEELNAHTVHKIRGKTALGNVAEASEPFDYEELILDLK